MDDSILDDFLVDSHEGLDRMDGDLLALERDPSATGPIASAFRSLHTIKGTCSFLGLRRLERVAHAGEALLAAVRAGRLRWSRAIADALLATADAVRAILAAIESTRREPEGDDAAVVARLAACLAGEAPERSSGPSAVVPAPEPPAAAEAAAAPEISGPTPFAGQGTSALQQQHLRVDVQRLDAVMDLVGELVLARNHLVRTLAAAGTADHSRAGSGLGAAAQRLDHVTTRLQDEVMRTRMQPVSAAWARLPRLVRDVALACGKRVRIEMQGDGTELDRALVEALKDPLTHLVRNAIDHGIEDAAARARAGKPEEGALRLSAYEEGGSVRLELADDGAGMDVERIRAQAIARGLVDAERARALSDEDYLAFVFVAGFSTAAKVTNISGRGVGLDAARAGIEAVGGSLTVRSTAGAGTTFHIRLPLTLAILPALTIEQSGDIYAIPQAHVLELVRCGGDHAHIEHAHGRAMFRLRGELLPVVELGRWLAAGDAGETPEPHADAEHAARHVLVLAAEGARYGLAVERVRDTEEIVVKPIGHRLREGGAFAGATVLGDGRVALILDAHALALRAGTGQATTTAPAAAAAAAAPERATRVPLLLVRARRGVRAAVPLAEVDRVVEFESAAFERLHEQPAVRLDGEVLEVAAFAGDPSLAAAGGPGCAEFAGAPRMWPVLIHGGNGHRVGLVVDQVVDIVDWDGAEAPAARGATGQRRIVLDDHITDLVTLSEEAA